MSRTNNPNLNNTNADTAVQVKVTSPEFKNVNQGGVIGGAVDSRLYLSENGEARLVQGTPILGQQAPRLYDFEKGDWTPLGKELIPDENDRTNLLNATKIELQNEIIRRKRTNPNQKDVTIGADSIINSDGEQINQTPPPPEEIVEEEKAAAFNPEDFKGIQRSDRVLQKLSLRNLKYPIDADYGNTQDYIQINQFTYKAVNPEVLFAPEVSSSVGSGKFATWREDAEENRQLQKDFANKDLNSLQLSGKQAKSTLLNGLSMQSPKEEHVGLVKLPMPNQLSDSNNVAWGEDQLNAITAAAATIAAGGLDTGINFLEDIASGDKGLGEAFSSLLTGGKDAAGGIIQFLKDAKGSRNANLLARSTVGSGLLNLVGFGVSPEAILARGAGVVPNSNLQLLFNAPTLRAFRFDWKMSPRSREEAIRVNNIIRFFKQGMAAKKMQPNSGGGAYFLGTPNVFDITFRTSKLKRELGNENISVMRMKTCACVGAAVNYTPEGMWNAYEKGQTTSCILSLQFKELEPIFNTDYEEDPFVYSNMGDFVPTDSVGY